MTKEEYKEYQERVSRFFELEGINNLSTISDITGSAEEITCKGCNEEVSSEPFFSSRSCDCCGSTLGGDRYHCSGYNPTTKDITCYDVCSDCLYYAEYGQLDDMQMMEIDEQETKREEVRE